MRENEVMQENRTIEAAIEAYYSGLSDEEARELEAWGEFASKQLATDFPEANLSLID